MGFGQETPPSSIQLGSHRHSQYNDILYSALNAHSNKNYVIQYTTDKGGTLSNEINSHDDAESVVLETHERKRAVKLTSEMAEGGSSEGITKTDNDEDIKAEMIKRLDEIKPSLESLDDIPLVFRDSPIKCLKSSTQEQICFYLDPPTDIPADGDEGRHLPKDYRGLSEWVGQEQAFVKYLTKCMSNWKTSEVIGKWITSEGEPKPTLGNFRECMIGPGGIDRPDIITDLAPIICKDAFEWESTKYEANTTPPIKEDTSWQLTRHDVVTGKKTYYTCCLVYADEDEGMAQVVTKMYKTVRRDAMFFLPQFDLKKGKYEYETTARVIEERCSGKVIFILSEYFFASHVCQFAVQFAAALAQGAGNGNLIPFHLTNKIDHVPAVLRGIAGIRWFRKGTRNHVWDTMTDTILGGQISPDDMAGLKERITNTIESDREYYLSDPPYDEDTPLPGEPIEIIEPENSVNLFPTPDDWPFQPPELKHSLLKQFKDFIKKKIVNKVYKGSRKKDSSYGTLAPCASGDSLSVVYGEVAEESTPGGDSSRASSASGSGRRNKISSKDGTRVTASNNKHHSVNTSNTQHHSVNTSNTQTKSLFGNRNNALDSGSSSNIDPHSEASLPSQNNTRDYNIRVSEDRKQINSEQTVALFHNSMEHYPEAISLKDMSSFSRRREPTENEEEYTVVYRRRAESIELNKDADNIIRTETESLLREKDTSHNCETESVNI